MWTSSPVTGRLGKSTGELSDFLVALGGTKWYVLPINPTEWFNGRSRMRFFTGQYDRTIDAKNRVQLPSQMRNVIDRERDGSGLYVTLGEHRGTLSIFTERGFEDLAERMETEFEPGPESLRFELQFFALASRVDIDKQGRFVLPDLLVKKARLAEQVYLVGQKVRIDVWNRTQLDESMGIDWKGDEWPDWHGFLRRRPQSTQ